MSAASASQLAHPTLTWQNNAPWDRRAIIWSGLALSPDEMNYWLKRVQNAGDLLDGAIAEAALALGNSTLVQNRIGGWAILC